MIGENLKVHLCTPKMPRIYICIHICEGSKIIWMLFFWKWTRFCLCFLLLSHCKFYFTHFQDHFTLDTSDLCREKECTPHYPLYTRPLESSRKKYSAPIPLSHGFALLNSFRRQSTAADRSWFSFLRTTRTGFRWFDSHFHHSKIGELTGQSTSLPRPRCPWARHHRPMLLGLWMGLGLPTAPVYMASVSMSVWPCACVFNRCQPGWVKCGGIIYIYLYLQSKS